MDLDKLYSVYIDQLFAKYDINPKEIQLSEEEKQKMKSIVENIQQDVEKFLENVQRQTTEHDVGNNTVEVDVDEATEGLQTYEPPTKPKMFMNKKDEK
ncbi:hypothetical protein ACERII_04760 [Evansella sp. AB-rgal1]|uniref:hypothetical protein n=1 Tax=Evansella sp. AB-rgal1 TaxID=3242696 RepID=UPI00359DFF82